MQIISSAVLAFLVGSVIATPLSTQSTPKVLERPTEQCGDSTVLPGLLVPIKQNEPDTAFGTQYRGIAAQCNNANKVSTIASFGLDVGRPQCHLKFVVPSGQSGNYIINGTKQIEIFEVAPFDYKSITWNKRPARGVSRGVLHIQVPGESNTLDFPCKFPYGEIEIAPSGGDVHVEWFELANPTLGLVMTQN